MHFTVEFICPERRTNGRRALTIATTYEVSICELGWRFMRKYNRIHRRAVARANAARLARDNNVDREQTNRKSRLEGVVRAAEADVLAAKHMLVQQLHAQRTLPDPRLREWLMVRIGNFNWRAEYARVAL